MSERQSEEPPFLRVLSSLPVIQSYDFAARYATPIAYPQGNRIKLWPRQGFHEGNLVKSLHGIDVS